MARNKSGNEEPTRLATPAPAGSPRSIGSGRGTDDAATRDTPLAPAADAREPEIGTTLAVPEERLRELSARSKVAGVAPARGDRFGDGDRFEVIRELGAGGMGSVYLAHDAQLDRPVAIKFILRDSGREQRLPWEQLVALLQKEAKATAKLNHENIVSIFDLGTWPQPGADPVPFLVMEYLEGEPLDAMIEHERLPAERAVEVMVQVARGLEHAHRHGIIHRDLKPSNVFILKDGRAKILDFGLAHFDRDAAPVRSRARSPSSGGDRRSSAPRGGSSRGGAPTLSGAGTPAYMAPEQWKWKQQDARTDVWAAGVMFFELLTGELPYAGSDLRKLRTSQLTRLPAPSVVARGVALPEEVDRVIARALAKDPQKRFQHGGELHAALLELQASLSGRAPAGHEARRAPERRQVTLLACQLAPRAGAALDDDPEEATELLGAFHRACADAVRAGGGSVVTSVGGKLLACFGYPIAHEDDAARSVRAARSIFEKSTHARFQTQIGVHTGPVVVEEMAAEKGPAATVIQGGAPAVAAALAARAAPGTVLITQPTFALVRGLFVAEPLGPLPLEGASQPIAAFRVEREREVESRFDQAFAGADPTPLVGRQGKVKLLLGLWEQAKASRGQLAMLSGEPGIGKSRLVRVLKDRVVAEGSSRMICQCWPQLRNSALHPLIELLPRVLGIAREDPPDEKRRKLEHGLWSLSMDVATHAPLLASLLSLEPSPSPAPPTTPAQQKKRTLEALATFLLSTSLGQPLLFVVEDLHWADHTTLELLQLLVDLIETAPVMVLVTFRPEFHPSWPERAHLHHVALDRLSPKLVAALAQRAAGSRALAAEVIDQLVLRTDGVPLFVEEMARMLAESDSPTAAAGASLAIPATLNELLLARLDRLSSIGKEVAQLGSVLGRAFGYLSIRELAAAARIDETQLQQGLQRLIDAGLLLAQGRPPSSRYQFKHALIQDTAHQSLLKKKRQEHHRRAAEVLSLQFPEITEVQPELLAHHYSEAGDVEPALLHWERAARRAVERSANVEAIAHFQRAISLLKTFPESPDRDQKELALQLSLGAPLMAVKGYANPEVETTYARAHELSRRADDAQLFPSLLGLWNFYMVGGQIPRSLETAETLLSLAERADNPVFRMLAHRAVGTSSLLHGEFARGRDHTERGLSLYSIDKHRSLAFRFGQDPGMTNGIYLAWSLWFLGRPDSALDRARAAQTLARELNHPLSIAFADCYTAMILNYRGEHEAARDLAQSANALSTEHRFALWLAWGTMMHGWALAALGDPRGLPLLKEGIAGWRQTGARAGLTFFPVTLADCALRAGKLDEAAAALADAEATVERNREYFYQCELLRLKGELLIASNDQLMNEAESSFREGLAVARSQSARAWELRLATSFARHIKKNETRAILEDAITGFDEGLSTSDVMAARSLLSR